MSEALADIQSRIESVGKLRTVVSALRGMAAARARQSEAQIAAVDRYAATLVDALGRAAAMLPGWHPTAAPQASVTVAYLAQQAFAGSFSGKVLDALGTPSGQVVLVGSRGAVLAAERGLSPLQSLALPEQPAALPRFADRLSGLLLSTEGEPAVDVLYTVSRQAGSSEVVRDRVFPFPPPEHIPEAPPPLVNLDPQELLVGLMSETLQAGLIRAALHSRAAENTARMLAMSAAERQTERKLGALKALERQVRQETITAEIVELASGEASFRSRDPASAR